MIEAVGINGEKYECCGDGYDLMFYWRSVDTFVYVGRGNTILFENGMGIKADITMRQNGFIGAHFQFEQQFFDMYFKDTHSLLTKFSIYVVDEWNQPITKVASIKWLHP